MTLVERGILTKIILSAIKGVGSGKSVIDIHQQEDISMLHKLNEGSMLCFESLNIIGTWFKVCAV